MQIRSIGSSFVICRWGTVALALVIALLLNSLTTNAQDEPTFPARHASGTVVDFAGKPVKGATVYNNATTVR